MGSTSDAFYQLKINTDSFVIVIILTMRRLGQVKNKLNKKSNLKSNNILKTNTV